LAGRGDDPGEAAADGHRASRAVGRATHGGANPEGVALAKEDDGRVGAVGRLEEHPEELVEERGQIALFEGGAGDALEGHEAPHGFVALARVDGYVAPAEVFALAEEVDERLHACAPDVGVEGLGDVVGGAPATVGTSTSTAPSGVSAAWSASKLAGESATSRTRSGLCGGALLGGPARGACSILGLLFTAAGATVARFASGQASCVAFGVLTQ